jgi:hypothetical protein
MGRFVTVSQRVSKPVSQQKENATALVAFDSSALFLV